MNLLKYKDIDRCFVSLTSLIIDMDIKIDKDILHLEKFPKEIKASFPVQTTVNYK